MIGAVSNYPDNVTGHEPELTGEWPCGECARPMRATCSNCDEPVCGNPSCTGCECENDDEDDATFASGDTFSMTVQFGNAAMREGEDLVRPLRQVADRLVNGETSGSIRDENGNTVGAWSIKPADARVVGHYDRQVR